MYICYTTFHFSQPTTALMCIAYDVMCKNMYLPLEMRTNCSQKLIHLLEIHFENTLFPKRFIHILAKARFDVYLYAYVIVAFRTIGTASIMRSPSLWLSYNQLHLNRALEIPSNYCRLNKWRASYNFHSVVCPFNPMPHCHRARYS